MSLDNPILFAATTNPAQSRKFYEETLGFKLVSDDPFALVFQVGPLQLRLQKVERKPDIPYTVLGWAVKDIRKTVHHLSQAGVKFSHYPGLAQNMDGIWQSPAGAKIAWFPDPDGNTLSLTEYPH